MNYENISKSKRMKYDDDKDHDYDNNIDLSKDDNGDESFYNINYLNNSNSHERDAFIKKNDATHEYFVNDKKISLSGTQFKKLFMPDFDGDKLIDAMFRKSCVTGERYKSKNGSDYDGMTREEMKEFWDTNRDNGTKFHLCAEYLFNNPNIFSMDNKALYKTLMDIQNHLNITGMKEKFNVFVPFVHRLLKNGFKPYRTEWPIYDEIINIAGTIDAVFYKDDEKGRKFYLFDWKTVRKHNIKESFNGNCYYPFEKMKASKETEYLIQLNLYSTILKSKYNMIIEKIYAVCISDEKCMLVDISRTDMQPCINVYLNHVKLMEYIGNWKISPPGSSNMFPFLTEPLFKNNSEENTVLNI